MTFIIYEKSKNGKKTKNAEVLNKSPCIVNDPINLEFLF